MDKLERPPTHVEIMECGVPTGIYLALGKATPRTKKKLAEACVLRELIPHVTWREVRLEPPMDYGRPNY